MSRVGLNQIPSVSGVAPTRNEMHFDNYISYLELLRILLTVDVEIEEEGSYL